MYMRCKIYVWNFVSTFITRFTKAKNERIYEIENLSSFKKENQYLKVSCRSLI